MTNRLTFPDPTEEDLRELTAFRHDLHRNPELPGEERETARRVCEMLAPTRPDHVLTGLGGHGVAAIFDSGAPGPTIMFRAELDALPIQELGEIAHRSTVPGKAHLCGHDGHMTILLGFARILSRKPPSSGRVVLMFQPAEEDGSGAAAVIADPRYDRIRPDWAFALHNMPGIEFGTGKISIGVANCASRGVWIRLTGSTAHASRPSDGRSPMQAMCEIMPALENLGSGQPLGPDFTMVTLTHATMGAESYGVAPGEALIMATLRTVADDQMDALVEQAETLIRDVARRHDLQYELGYDDVFLACTNAPEAVAHLTAGLERAGMTPRIENLPSVASEDFGRFGLGGAYSAMVFLGAGLDRPGVHTPEYDFRDEMIPMGIRLYSETLAECLSES